MSHGFLAQFDEPLQSVNGKGVTTLYSKKRKKFDGNAVFPYSDYIS